MKPEDLNLKEFRKHTLEALEAYKEWGYEFSDFDDYRLTPEKSNTARTVIPVSYKGQKAGDMYAIVFLQGDGTGDESSYKLADLEVPEHLKYKEKPERVVPRAKTGIINESAFPLFSQHRNTTTLLSGNLNVLGLKGNKITDEAYIGLPGDDFLFSLISGRQPQTARYFTVYTDKKGERHLDPHAIHFGFDYRDGTIDTNDIVQVFGFLAIKDKDNPLLERWM